VHIGQLTHSGFTLNATADLEAARREFTTNHFVRFERFIAPLLLDRWLRQLADAVFTLRLSDDWVGPPPIDLFLNAPEVECAIEFSMNDAALFRAVESIAGTGPLGSFLANIHRTVAGAGHRDGWHNDVDGERAVGISINVSAGGYRGGTLEFADARSRAALASVDNPVAGGAVLFEISEALVHLVSPLEAGERTVLAGWFMRTPDERAWREALVRRLS
jgi:hypothetical protein